LFILFFCSSLSLASSLALISRLSTFLTGVPNTSAGLGTLILTPLPCSLTGVLLFFLPSSISPSIILLSELSQEMASMLESSVSFSSLSSFLFFFTDSSWLLRFLFILSSLNLSGERNTLVRLAGGGVAPSSSSSSSSSPSSLSKPASLSSLCFLFMSCSRNRLSKLLLEDILASSSRATALLLSGPPPGLREFPEPL